MNGALPSFDLGEGGLVLAFARGLAVASMLSVAGALVFRAFVLPGGLSMPGGRLQRSLMRLIWFSQAAQFLSLFGWLMLQASALADATTVGDFFKALLPVLTGTGFGHLIAAQAVFGGAACLVLGRGGRGWQWRLAALLALAAVLIQAGHGHGYAMDGASSALATAAGVHLLGAAAWLGGLVPLLLAVRQLPAEDVWRTTRSFSRLATFCVGGLLLSAAYQAWVLVGDPVALVGTAYGWTILVKASLFLALLGFAAANRFRVTPALPGDGDDAAHRRLVRNIVVETCLGLGVVMAAAILSTLPPGMHVQSIWPFTLRPSLAVIAEDPDFRHEVVMAILELALGFIVLAFGLAMRRLRWPALVLALVLVGIAVPHLDLLLVEAYPTSFFHSPTGFAADVIARGASLYPANCAACHGADGHGDGPLAKTLPVPPADLTAGHLFAHSDGELFWWLEHGIDAPEGGLAMPGFAATLDDDQRWSLIDFIRARNVGLHYQASGGWAPPVRAPDIAATCPGGMTVTIADLAGKIVRIAFVAATARFTATPLPAAGNVAIVNMAVSMDDAMPSDRDICIVRDPAVVVAYAIVAGSSPDALAGAQFLVDPAGWLRGMQLPGAAAAKGWDDPAALQAAISEICGHPIVAVGGGAGHHHGA